MGKILLATGELAEGMVRRYAAESSRATEVVVLPISIAAFMTSRLLIKTLSKLRLKEYSAVLVPGLAKVDLEEVERELGVSVFKGPKHAADLPWVLEEMERGKLSKEIPACELLGVRAEQRAREQLKRAEQRALEKLSKPWNFRVGEGRASIPAGRDFPPRIVAEIADAPLRSDREVLEVARRYVEAGAEILDLGMVAGREMPEEVPRLVALLKENFNLPLSINTSSEAEIEEALGCGVDMVLSLDSSTLERFPGLEVPVVLVPIDKRGRVPRGPEQRVKRMLGLVQRAQELGYKRVVADPILEPLNQGFVGSLLSFYRLREVNPELPILMGIGNVIELCDADSVGMTALLVGAASELGASFVLAVEGSDKTRGNVEEVRRARDMMTLARLREAPPKDLGLDLLVLKEKRRIFDPFDERARRARVVQARPRERRLFDPRGFFRIFVDGQELVAVLYRGRGPEVMVRGKTAEEVCGEIVERGLVSELGHAAYLGRELQKAEVALRTGRGYIQGKEIF